MNNYSNNNNNNILLHFCSSVFTCSCSDITAFCCTIPFFREYYPGNGHSCNFLFSIDFFPKSLGILDTEALKSNNDDDDKQQIKSQHAIQARYKSAHSLLLLIIIRTVINVITL